MRNARGASPLFLGILFFSAFSGTSLSAHGSTDDRIFLCQGQFEVAAGDVVDEFGRQIRNGGLIRFDFETRFGLTPDRRAEVLGELVASLGARSNRRRHHTEYLKSAVMIYARQASEMEYYMTYRLAEFLKQQHDPSKNQALSPVAEQWLDRWVRGRLNIWRWLWRDGVQAGFRHQLYTNAAAAAMALASGPLFGESSPNAAGLHAVASISALFWTLDTLQRSYAHTSAPRSYRDATTWEPFDAGAAFAPIFTPWFAFDTNRRPTVPPTTLDDLYFITTKYIAFARDLLETGGGAIDLSEIALSSPLPDMLRGPEARPVWLGQATAMYFQLVGGNKDVFKMVMKATFGTSMTPELARALDGAFRTDLALEFQNDTTPRPE